MTTLRQEAAGAWRWSSSCPSPAGPPSGESTEAGGSLEQRGLIAAQPPPRVRPRTMRRDGLVGREARSGFPGPAPWARTASRSCLNGP